MATATIPTIIANTIVTIATIIANVITLIHAIQLATMTMVPAMMAAIDAHTTRNYTWHTQQGTTHSTNDSHHL